MTSISIVGVVFGIQFISSTTLEMNNEDIGLGRRTGGSVCKLEGVSLGCHDSSTTCIIGVGWHFTLGKSSNQTSKEGLIAVSREKVLLNISIFD